MDSFAVILFKLTVTHCWSVSFDIILTLKLQADAKLYIVRAGRAKSIWIAAIAFGRPGSTIRVPRFRVRLSSIAWLFMSNPEGCLHSSTNTR